MHYFLLCNEYCLVYQICQGTGPIILDNVRCNGLELYITDCPNIGYFQHYCGHYEDAGVTCIRKDQPETTQCILKLEHRYTMVHNSNCSIEWPASNEC